ncbi:MAG: acyltransferase [Bacteroidales bacterium]|nr:acyltransferase [Bacteroidales bacterium]
MADCDFKRIITISRFPLICIVIVGHALGFTLYPVEFGNFSSYNIYHFITEMISHVYAPVSVNIFFFFSGYLFFTGFGNFSAAWVKKKWSSRVRSLLIPYILWNLLDIVAILVKNGIFSLFGHYSAEEMGFCSISQFFNWFTLPADFPLWYIRDLMILVLFAPLLFIAIRKFPIASLLALVALYASPLNPSVPGMCGIFFFGVGAYAMIRDVDVMGLCRKFRIAGHILAAATLLLAVFHNDSEFRVFYMRLFYPFGIVSFLNLMDAVSQRGNISDKLAKLSETVFFIYAVHEIYILGWSKGLCLRLFGDSITGMYLSYFLVPVIVLTACLALYSIAKRFTPKTLNFLCGGRKPIKTAA